MKKIQLGGHQKGTKIHGYAIVDDDMFKELNQWNWFLNDGGYAVRNRSAKEQLIIKKSCFVRMHRVVNNTPDDLITDHIDKNKINNTRQNLRTADKSLNGINRDKPGNNTSGYKGVHRDLCEWRAEIGINGKKIKLGRFINIEDAVKARLTAEKKYHAI